VGGRAEAGRVPAGFAWGEPGGPGQLVAWDVPMEGLYSGGGEWVLEVRVEGSVFAHSLGVAAVGLNWYDGIR